MKVHTATDLNGNSIEYLLTKENVDDRDVLYELSNMTSIDILFGNKGYVGQVEKELKQEKGIKIYALIRHLISKLR